jgi:hypothetical protein
MEEVRFAFDSPLEEAVTSEPVSENGSIPDDSGWHQVVLALKIAKDRCPDSPSS